MHHPRLPTTAQDTQQNRRTLFNGIVESGVDKPSATVSKSLSSQGSAGSASAKVSKSRTRPTQKSPITVLSADTSNFKAMVQQLTGIPMAPPRQAVFNASATITLPILRRYQTQATSQDCLPRLGRSSRLLCSHLPFASENPQQLTAGTSSTATVCPFKTGYTGETTDVGILAPNHAQRTLPCATCHDFELHNASSSASPMWDPVGRANCRDAGYLRTCTRLARSAEGANAFHAANAVVHTNIDPKFSPGGLAAGFPCTEDEGDKDS